MLRKFAVIATLVAIAAVRSAHALDHCTAPEDLVDASALAQGTSHTTQHSIVVAGKRLTYDATAGAIPIGSDDSAPRASIFYVDYVLVDSSARDRSRRPVTFFYNGGPGSSSMLLHLGSFAPVRLLISQPVALGPPPHPLSTNEQTLLDKTDLVFIDAVGTGYSRPVGEGKGKEFWGVDQDAAAFARAISRYITLNSRWGSPKFLFGESYGTARTAALVNLLQDQGMTLSGVILMSCILNYGVRDAGFDQIFVEYLPTYAAVSWYYGRSGTKEQDLAAYLREVRAYARGPYAQALSKGTDLSPGEEEAVADKIAEYTGLSSAFIKSVDLRVDFMRLRKELLRDRRRTIGRLDARFEGMDADAGGDVPEYDAADTAVVGAFAAALRNYLTEDLNFRSTLEYAPTSPEVYAAWDWHHKVPGTPLPSTYPVENTPDLALDLAGAMRKNPQLKVLVLAGLFDLATPFGGAEYDFSHMQLDPALRKNVTFRYYESGHQIYFDPESLRQMKVDVDSFYEGVTPR